MIVRIRFGIVMVICLLLAEAVQMALLPPLHDALPAWTAPLFLMRLLAVIGLVAGLLRGESTGLWTALAAAVLFGFSTDMEYLGAALVSYGTTAFLAGLLARLFRFNGALTRWLMLSLLLAVEALLWCAIRKLFWPAAHIEIPWTGILLTAFAGSLLYDLLARVFKRNLFEED